MEILSGTRVALRGARLYGTVVMPEPDQQPAPDVGTVLVEWDERHYPAWEYVEDLVIST